MVLGSGHGDNRLAVGKRQHGGFLAFHEFLDDNAISRVAEGFLVHQEIDRLDRLVRRLRQDYALARRETVRLDSERLPHLPDVNVGAGRIAKDLAARRRDFVTTHDDLRIDLRAFQLGSVLRRAEGLDACCRQRVHDAVYQRHLRADYHEADIFLLRQRDNRVVVLHRDAGNALGKIRDAGIARNGVQLIRMHTLAELPRQRVLASAAADQ